MKTKIASLTLDAIDRMDLFVRRCTKFQIGGKLDYWNELQEIIDAGVTFEENTKKNSDAASVECLKGGSDMQYSIRVKVTGKAEGKPYVEVDVGSPLYRQYFAARFEGGEVSGTMRRALVESVGCAVGDIIDDAMKG